MVARWVMILLLAIPRPLSAEEVSRVRDLLGSYRSVGLLESEDTSRILNDLQQVKVDFQGSFPQSLRQLGLMLHKKYLKTFVPQAEFRETLATGRYNCLTAVTLFMFYYEFLEIPYELVETRYHVFIIVYTPSGERILVETTDPLSGIITGELAVQTRILSYREQLSASADGRNVSYQYKSEIENTVKADELIGMLLYNQAVDQFNRRGWEGCVENLEKATRYYKSPRIEELAKVTRLAIAEEPSLTDQVKSELLVRIQQLRRLHARMVAGI